MDLAGAMAHEAFVFCGTITTDDGEGRWNVVPGRQRGNQKARLQAMLAARRSAAERSTQAMAVRNPFALLSEPAAAATSSSGVRRGAGGNSGETVSESIGKTTHTNTHTNINSNSSNKSVRSEVTNGAETCFGSCCAEICDVYDECEDFACGVCEDQDDFSCCGDLRCGNPGLQLDFGTGTGKISVLRGDSSGELLVEAKTGMTDLGGHSEGMGKGKVKRVAFMDELGGSNISSSSSSPSIASVSMPMPVPNPIPTIVNDSIVQSRVALPWSFEGVQKDVCDKVVSDKMVSIPPTTTPTTTNTPFPRLPDPQFQRIVPQALAVGGD